MLGATVTSMDAGLNKAVGVFVRSFYMPLGNALAKQGDGKWGRLMLGDEGHHEKRLLHVGKFSTLGFGVLIIGFALVINAFRTSNLFDFSNQLAATLVMPLALPLVLGLFYKRTPHWSAWSTALVGFVFSLILGLPSVLEGMENVFWGHVFDGDNRTYFKLFTTTFGSVGLGAVWFFFTSLFYEKGSQEHKNRVETFFANLRTPVDKQGAAVEESQTSVYGLLGTLCIVYGVFVLALMAIPNSFRGRMCFLFCGGVIAGMGFVLFSISKKRKNLVTGAVTEEVEKPTLEEEEAALSD
jgi:solute:Na+ symporter, SSS family